MRRGRVAMILAAGAVIGAIAGWWRPLPLANSQAGQAAERWSLPDPITLERSSATMIAATRGLPWVGDVGSAIAGGSSEWTLLGVLPPEAAALVQAGKDPVIKRLKIGDILPDGARLSSVERDSVIVDLDGCVVRYRLYARPSDEADLPACAASAPDQETPQP